MLTHNQGIHYAIFALAAPIRIVDSTRCLRPMLNSWPRNKTWPTQIYNTTTGFSSPQAFLVLFTLYFLLEKNSTHHLWVLKLFNSWKAASKSPSPHLRLWTFWDIQIHQQYSCTVNIKGSFWCQYSTSQILKQHIHTHI